jgi:succinyl-diaminopimelate desuccinylase
MTDPVALLQELIRCPSVSPADAGALGVLEKFLSAHGFVCHRLNVSDDRGGPDIPNLYARWGGDAPHLCFSGHTDVVPPGDEKVWTHPPFAGEIKDGRVWGRGASDMKGAVAAFACAAAGFVTRKKPKGSVSLLLAGDEEVLGCQGTKKVLDWMAARGEKLDFCLGGEPTSRETLGDMIKIGRRGNFTAYLTVKGVQGHAAYPHLADNPIPKLLTLLKALDGLVLDEGTAHFQPSNLEIVTVDVGNKADNVIPGEARATINVRFNDLYTGKTLEQKLRGTLDAVKIPYLLEARPSGESFYTPPGPHSAMIVEAIRAVTGREPEISTSGGTSDARFIRQYCPVVEFGSVGLTAHHTDENVREEDVHALSRIYTGVMERFFGFPSVT